MLTLNASKTALVLIDVQKWTLGMPPVDVPLPVPAGGPGLIFEEE